MCVDFVRVRSRRCFAAKDGRDRPFSVHVSHNALVQNHLIATTPEMRRRILWIQTFTIIWMAVEAVVALVSSWKTRSPALLGFGGDSLIELLSAVVVYWRFRSERTDARIEKGAARIAGALLFSLAGFVVIASAAALLGYSEAQTSFVGIALLLIAAFVMPWLAGEKRRLSAVTSSAALRADAAESALCGYMAWISMTGLVLNAVWKIRWADPVAALSLIPIVLHEGWEATKGKPCKNC